MDISMASMLQSQSQIITQVSTAVLNMNLDTVEGMGDSLVKMMEQSVNPNVGQNIDIKI
ncbi:putative motility protein [Anaerocolumna sedimenticola]|uniref:Putative motility protein n=1 Tax=Anaerocolumna sedimenticola TaxID=2696063 RepID=A0A6P1TIZ0_9FIRM|nr:YjfB family protein [Anaerocolumna sedimenticola]QHQ60011.1 putative motility protein [Anaerocolumna sedimenticola]